MKGLITIIKEPQNLVLKPWTLDRCSRRIVWFRDSKRSVLISRTRKWVQLFRLSKINLLSRCSKNNWEMNPSQAINTFQDHLGDNASYLITIRETLIRKFRMYITVRDALLLGAIMHLLLKLSIIQLIRISIILKDIRLTIAYSTNTFQTKTLAC